MTRLRAYLRFFVVAKTFLPLLIAFARDRNRFLLFGSSREVTGEQRQKRAQLLLEAFISLGPTFIKLGQVLSTRPDALPSEYVETLVELQDRVPAADWGDVKSVVEEDIGDVEEYYDDFNREAVSGASLGQVHFAEVDGEQVAVKIRRPNVMQQVKVDLQVLDWGLPILLYFLDEARSFSVKSLSDEFDSTIIEEMDYGREREMLLEIRGNFEGDDMIRIPDVYDSRCSERVLTMEFIDGEKIDDLDAIQRMGLDRTELADRLQRAYFQMILEDGLFHADPHPGNLAVQSDGTIVFYDFGMTGTTDDKTRDRVIDLYAAIATDNVESALDALIELGILSSDADRQLMAEVVEIIVRDMRGQFVDQYKVEGLVMELQDTMYEFPFRLPPEFALLLRVATITNGVTLTLDPSYDFIEAASEYLKDNGLLQDSLEKIAQDRVKSARDAGRSAFRTPRKLEQTLDTINNDNLSASVRVDENDRTFEKLGQQIVLGILSSGLVIATAILYTMGDGVSAYIGLVATIVSLMLLYWSF